MKLKQLLESPTFTPSQQARWESDDFISQQNIHKFYQFLGAVKIDNKMVEFFMLQNNKKLIGCIKSKMPWDGNEVGYHEIFVLVLTPPTIQLPANIQYTKIIQTKDVSTDLNFEGRGLATFVYFNILVDLLGYTVISDENHMFGGVKLWRKLSKEALHHNLKICLIKDGEYVLDKNNKPLIFNDTNFPKSKIWSTLPNQAGKNVLFVIQRIL